MRPTPRDPPPFPTYVSHWRLQVFILVSWLISHKMSPPQKLTDEKALPYTLSMVLAFKILFIPQSMFCVALYLVAGKARTNIGPLKKHRLFKRKQDI